MATTIVTKSGSGAPAASDLVAGELAVDLTNGRLYTEDSGGTVLELGLNPNGNVNVTGTVTADGLTVGDTSDSQSLIQMLANPTNGANTIHFGDGTSADAYVGYINYAHDSNSMQFAAGGTERLRIDGATGNVGIGCTPSNKLDIKGTVGFEATNSTNKWLAYHYTDNTLRFNYNGAGADELVIDSSGSVGIGVSPNYPIHVEKSVSGDWLGKFKNTHATNGYGLLIHAGDDASVTALSVGNYAGAGDYLVVKGDGNVGIGTSSPANLLHLDSGTGTTAWAKFENTDNSGLIGYDNADAWLFYNGTSESMRINASGNLFLGRTGGFTFSTNTTDGVALQPNRIDVSAASVCRISQLRDSTGTYDRFYNGSSIVGSITGTTSATAYNTSSDQRLKDNIADADDAGSKIDAIQVRKFDWKADGSHQDYGMVAQELQAVAPEAVSAPEDPEEMMGVDYSKLVPMMLKEIQSLRARITQLES